MSNIKKKDDEFLVLVVVNLIFTLALIGIDVFYSDWPGMLDAAYYGIPGILAIIAHIVIVLIWALVLRNWDDPNYDKYRIILLILIVVVALTVGGFRAAMNERNAVIDDSNQAKHVQE